MSSPKDHTRRLLIAAALRCGGLWLWLLAGQARAEPCPSERFELTQSDPAELLARARELAAEQRYGRARFVYETLLARHQEEREAALGKARVDAWEQCYASAEAAFRAQLALLPEDVEARVGLIDVLIWSDRRSDAEQEVAHGLSYDPQSPELLHRRATLSLRRDEPEEALRAAERALRQAPQDPELRALRDRIYFSQLRAYVRLDRYFGDYPDLHSVGLAYWRRLHALELSLDALLVERSGGALPQAIVDAQYNAGISYHFGPLATLGAVAGLGAPARALPRWLGRLWLSTQWSAAWSTQLSYAVWDYTTDKTVHILNPMLTFAPSDLLSFDLRYYGTWLVLHQPGVDPKRFVSTLALRATAQLTADLRLGLSYAYGAQLDQAALSEFISIRSHVLSLFADYRPQRSWGLQPVLSAERRVIRERALWIASFELGAYVRW